MNKEYFVYILKCADDSYYVGVTNDLQRRLEEHNNSEIEISYTFSRRPVTLVWHETHQYINNAIAREKQLKNWSRAKKEALINGQVEKLIPLAKKKTFLRYKNSLKK